MNKKEFIKQFGIIGYEWWVKQVTELARKELKDSQDENPEISE